MGFITKISTNAQSSDIGTIKMVAHGNVPSGYLECNGQVVSRTTYSALFSAIGTTFGAGDGSTTFKLPDLRGEFIRGWDHGIGIDAGRAIGSTQEDAIEQTSIALYGSSTSSGYSHYHTNSGGLRVGVADHMGVNVGNYTLGSGAETRPRNVAMMVVIKY